MLSARRHDIITSSRDHKTWILPPKFDLKNELAIRVTAWTRAHSNVKINSTLPLKRKLKLYGGEQPTDDTANDDNRRTIHNCKCLFR